MTKREAIENHRKMWMWIGNETLIKKRKILKSQYFDENKLELIEFLCFCCEYDKWQGNNQCEHCPIDWGSYKCTYRNSPYRGWMEANDYREAAAFAFEIANLPERME